VRVLIIGATGHIGSWLVPRLVNLGHDVIAVSRGARRPYRDSAAWECVQQVTIDRARSEEEGTFGRDMAELEPDVVVDLICFNVQSAAHIVDSFRGRVRLFLHCGSLWVHGVPKSRPYDESAAREPFGDYGVRKAEIERYLLDAAREGFPASVLHPGHITGPGWNPINPAGHLDVTVFEKLARGEKIALPDDGLATLQHVHVDDVASAFALAIEHPDRVIGEAFHVAAREPITMRDYAIGASEWFGRDASIEYLPWEKWKMTVSESDAAIARDHVLHSPSASIEKARNRLGFEPGHSALGAAHDAVSWLIDAGRLVA
jgi:nucleoside-diphosphate-sugar epimerase